MRNGNSSSLPSSRFDPCLTVWHSIRFLAADDIAASSNATGSSPRHWTSRSDPLESRLPGARHGRPCSLLPGTHLVVRSHHPFRSIRRIHSLLHNLQYSSPPPRTPRSRSLLSRLPLEACHRNQDRDRLPRTLPDYHFRNCHS
ncbi:hypothetical protein HPP92_004204 [Vanilla planifolia]|uniref:Uncharacterized protein n=1 Tax=Vanilla planifolia TaxID=51239 RepID=A0A835RZ20_VANPL|nr:hypothetical protein HPP92_004204 [Vanilla planifolia]